VRISIMIVQMSAEIIEATAAAELVLRNLILRYDGAAARNGEGMTTGKLETARRLARDHFQVDPQVRRIHLIYSGRDQDADEPIRLLEVVEGALECGVVPVGFAANPERGIAYPSVIVEVSPREFQAIREGTLPFEQDSWTVGEELSA